MKGSLHNFSSLLHCVISQLLWFKTQTFCASFVYIHITLSKWLSTLDVYTSNYL